MSTRARVGLLVLPGLFLGCLFAWPLAAILATGLDGGGWSTITAPSTRRVLAFTAGQAALSTVATFAVALPGAWVLGRIRFRGREAFRALVMVPFVLPTVVVAAAVLALVGPRGVLAPAVRLDGTLAAVVVAHVVFNYAVVARIVGGAWGAVDPRQEEAARTLGAGRSRVLATVVWPHLRGAVASAAVLTFLFCSTSFGAVVLLGAQDQATLETAIARATRTSSDLGPAAALALLQLVAVAALLLVEARLRDRRHAVVGAVPEAVALHRPRSGRERAGVAGAVGLAAVLLGAPIAVLAERSLRVGEGYGAGWFRALFEPGGRASVLFGSPWDAVRTSLGYAAMATAVSVVVGTAAAVAVASRRDRLARWAEAALALPLGASAVTVGLGFVVGLDAPPLDLRDSPLLVPLAHALLGVPFVVRAVVPALRSVDPRLRAAASVLGAGPLRAWLDVDARLSARALAVGAAFAFAVSLGEFGASSILVRTDRPTVTVAIGRLLGQPGAASFGQAAAMSMVLVAITAAAVLLVDRGARGGSGAADAL